MTARVAAGILAVGLAIVGLAGGALALEPVADEKERLKACEKQLCTLAVKKAGDDMKCALSKTWSRRSIEDGIKEKKISWGFGDARCAVAVDIKGADVVAAMKQPSHTLQLERHAVSCDIEREKEVVKVGLSLAPKLQFKDGKLEKAWLNVTDIDAPTVVKGAIWTVAKLEDNFGVFHGQLVGAINKLIHEKCPSRTN